MTSYSSSKEEIEVASTVQPFKEEPRASNKDFDKDLQRDEHVFSPVVLRSKDFHREVIGQFYSELLLFSDIAKAELIVFEPDKWKTSEFIAI